MNKKIVICLTGGIACYKIPALVSALKKEGDDIHIVMSRNACEFITPLTLKTISGNKVHTEIFTEDNLIPHLDIAKDADLVVYAPATANIISAMACGSASDICSALYLGFRGKVAVIPAMNTNMLEHKATQRNLKTLEQDGVFIMAPDCGMLACGIKGSGRLPEPEDIRLFIKRVIKKSDQNRKIIITGGGTREKIDPVRYISNASSGKFSYALAQESYMSGHDTTLITSAQNTNYTKLINCVHVSGVEDMYRAIRSEIKRSPDSVLIMNAAVSDFRPETTEEQKIKKKEEETEINLKLVKTRDILCSVREEFPQLKIMGFALETENLTENGLKKLHKKGLDWICINSCSSTMGKDSAEILLINKNGEKKEFRGSKVRVSEKIIEEVVNDTRN